MVLFLLEGGSSGDKCFDTYHGPEAFSEPETANVRDFIMARYFITGDITSKTNTN